MADGKARATGSVYRDEAADLMMAAAAARTASRPPPPELELTARRSPPPVRPESKRPLPYAEPVGINDNDDEEGPAPTPRLQRRPLSPLRLLARIVIAPLYVAVAVAAVGIVVLFGKGFFGL